MIGKEMFYHTQGQGFAETPRAGNESNIVAAVPPFPDKIGLV